MRFAQEGAKVSILDIQADKGEQTVRAIHDAGGEARFHQADVSQREEVHAGVHGTRRLGGELTYSSIMRVRSS